MGRSRQRVRSPLRDIPPFDKAPVLPDDAFIP